MTTTFPYPPVTPDPDGDYHQIKLHGMMVVGPGEGNRWLDACLAWHLPMLDTMFVYDDRTADRDDGTTFEVLKAHAAAAVSDLGSPLYVRVRPEGVASFLEHEGHYRKAAWDTWEATVKPSPGDGVLILDADEFVIPQHALIGGRAAMQASIGFARANDQDACAVLIREVFGFSSSGSPLIRVDGAWDGNEGPRLIAWTPGGALWPDRAMGSGSAPARYQWSPGQAWDRYGVSFFQIAHYGYAHPDDVKAKYHRYTAEVADHGHNAGHIASITRPPRLVPLNPPVTPTVWRGRKP